MCRLNSKWLVLILLNTIQLSVSVNIECHYGNVSFGHLGEIYTCQVTSQLNIISPEEAIITSISGTHESEKGNDDVLGFWIYDKIVHYFVQGLDIFFKNLQGIAINTSQIKHISQSNIRSFPNLSVLNFRSNNIEILEEGLFDYNPKLQFIGFSNGRIAKVHPEVFTNLNSLIYLDLKSNICIDISANNNATAVQIIIQQVRLQCPSPGSTPTPTPTTTSAPEEVECPESCSSQILELSQDFDTFRTFSHEQFQRFDEEMKNLTSANRNNTEKINNLEKKIANDMQQLNNTLQNQIQEIEESLQSSIGDIESNLTKKIEEFVDKSLPDIVQMKIDESLKEAESRIIENVENIVKELSDELTVSQNATITELKNKIQNVEDRLDNFICETSIRLQKIETSLTREQTKVLRIADAKTGIMKKELIDDMGKSIAALDEKFDKVLKNVV